MKWKPRIILSLILTITILSTACGQLTAIDKRQTENLIAAQDKFLIESSVHTYEGQVVDWMIEQMEDMLKQMVQSYEYGSEVTYLDKLDKTQYIIGTSGKNGRYYLVGLGRYKIWTIKDSAVKVPDDWKAHGNPADDIYDNNLYLFGSHTEKQPDIEANLKKMVLHRIQNWYTLLDYQFKDVVKLSDDRYELCVHVTAQSEREPYDFNTYYLIQRYNGIWRIQDQWHEHLSADEWNRQVIKHLVYGYLSEHRDPTLPGYGGITIDNITELDNSERLADITIEYLGKFQIEYRRDDYGKWYFETMKELPEQ